MLLVAIAEKGKAISMSLKLIFYALSLFALGSVSAQSKEEVIEKYLLAIGGKNKWISVKTMIDSGISIKFRQAILNQHKEVDTTYFKTSTIRPNFQKFSTFKKLQTEGSEIKWSQSIICYNGTYLWTGSPGNITRQSPEDSEYYFKLINNFGPYLFINDLGADITYVGKLNLNNEPFEVLKVRGSNQFFYQLMYFDRISGLLVCTVGYDTPTKMFTYLKDYKLFNGLLVPLLSESYVDGNLVDTVQIYDVHFNQTIDKDIFLEQQN